MIVNPKEFSLEEAEAESTELRGDLRGRNRGGCPQVEGEPQAQCMFSPAGVWANRAPCTVGVAEGAVRAEVV